VGGARWLVFRERSEQQGVPCNRLKVPTLLRRHTDAMLSARRVRALLIFGALLIALVVAGADRALAAESVTVTPSTGLHDDQTVRVEAVGYTPGEQLVVTECSAVAGASASDCAVSSARFAKADADGKVDVIISVYSGPFGLNHVRCDALPGCIISVSDISFSPTELATARIQFIAGASSGTLAPAAVSSGGFDPSTLLLLVPVLSGAAWAAAIFRWVRTPATLPLVAGGTLVIGSAATQAYVLLTAAGAASGINAAAQYAGWDLSTDAVGIALLATGVALRLDPTSRWRRLAVDVLSVLVLPSGLLLILPAVFTLGGGPQSEGGGTIWYGAAVCVAGAVVAALAQLIAFRKR